ncbi:hypothetical protein SAMN05428975_0767 [Mucilaginibacter sp. OK268]|jgi:hypothetical protein|uniref:hypothetical protein n=1 Tax=Mucilaginibacter sp. OK268 TaxID=1881048 RepID=UPI00089020CE|nr:hypothetical protein [Mucilaginibacter sp. OK268]SDP22408.1 hypothetical protein SAMN05428975_0767 [Mucilaginibacter sp. OK268]
MAGIEIPKQKAIKLLNDCIFDLDNSFDEKVWKSKTEHEVKAIFGVLDMRHLEISQLRFGSIVGVSSIDQINRSKETAKKLVQSYISFIEEHIPDPVQAAIAQPTWETKYNKLQTQYAQIQNSNSQLAEKVKANNLTIAQLQTDLAEKDAEIQRLKDSVFQLDELTIKKLFGIFTHLPIGTGVAVIAFLLTLIGFIFFAGVWAHTHGLASLS